MIHYHGLPMTGRDQPLMSLQGKHVMASFSSPEQLPETAELCQSFTMDNGAFNAWKAGTELDIEGFSEWVRYWYRHPGFDWYLIPDDIEGGEHENAHMRAKWFSLAPDLWNFGVPVWHLHEPLEVLNQFCVAFGRVALGSSGSFAQIGTSQWWSRMAEAMEVLTVDGFPRVKIHGLRMLDPTVFSHFPFASADSTNVARNIGLDGRWNGPYAPRSRRMRALILMERIEAHASASRWNGSGAGAAKNEELFG